MSPEQEHLIRATWAEIAPRAADLTDQFYQRLFELNPASRALFGHTDRTALGKKVIQILDEIVKVLDEPARLVTVLAPLGRHHAGFGVNHHHYQIGCTALMVAMRSIGGPGFTPIAELAWRELYTLVAAVMERAGDSGPVVTDASRRIPGRSGMPRRAGGTPCPAGGSAPGSRSPPQPR